MEATISGPCRSCCSKPELNSIKVASINAQASELQVVVFCFGGEWVRKTAVILTAQCLVSRAGLHILIDIPKPLATASHLVLRSNRMEGPGFPLPRISPLALQSTRLLRSVLAPKMYRSKT